MSTPRGASSRSEPALRPDLKQRVLEAARRAPSPPRAVVARRRAVALFVGALPALVGAARPVVGQRPIAFVLFTALGWGLLAVAATWGSLGARASGGGRTMGGAPSAWLLALAFATPVLLFALHAAGFVMWPELLGFDCAPAGHLSCAGLTTLFGAGPLAAFVYARRGTDPVHPGLHGAALGVAAGAWGAVSIGVHCPFTAGPHVMLGHIFPLALLGLVGAWLGRRVVAIRGDAIR